MKKDAQMGKECDEIDEMVYLLLILLFRQVNDLSILVVIVEN